MAKTNYLDGKRILIVDDEPDILESLEELLSMCELVKATTFEEAKEQLENHFFDMAILDIMGVDGFKLLEIANKNRVIAVMLTAHALSPENTMRSYEEGAASYVPKDKMADIVIYLNDIWEAKEKGKNFWWRWLERFATYYDRKFESDWKKDNKEFWDKLKYHI